MQDISILDFVDLEKIFYDNYDWQPPVAHPKDGKMYQWSEDDMNWKKIINN